MGTETKIKVMGTIQQIMGTETKIVAMGQIMGTETMVQIMGTETTIVAMGAIQQIMGTETKIKTIQQIMEIQAPQINPQLTKLKHNRINYAILLKKFARIILRI